MDWSYNHDRVMSVLERLENPKQYVEYYCCCLLVWRTRVRFSSTVEKYSTHGEDDLSAWSEVPYNNMTDNPMAEDKQPDK